MKNFRSCRWGSSLTVCARLTVRVSPHQHEWKFFAAHVCRVTFKHLPQPLRSYIRSFRTLGQLLKTPPFQLIVRGERGVPNFFWGLESCYFCELGAHATFRNHTTIFENTPLSPQICHSAGGRGVPELFCKISEPYDNPFWDFSNSGKIKKERNFRLR